MLRPPLENVVKSVPPRQFALEEMAIVVIRGGAAEGGELCSPKSGWDDVAMGVNRRELLLVAGGVTIVALGAEGARRVWAQIAADVPPATALEARHVAIITKLANMILPTTGRRARSM